MNRFLQAPLLRIGLSHLERSRWQSVEHRSRLSLFSRHFGAAVPDSSESKGTDGPTKGSDRIRSLLSRGKGNNLDEKGAKLSKADIVRRLQKYVWPAAGDPDVPHVAGVKARVIGSVALLIASKAVLIQVPYFFKRLIDTMGLYAWRCVVSAGDVGRCCLVNALLLAFGLDMCYVVRRYACRGRCDVRRDDGGKFGACPSSRHRRNQRNRRHAVGSALGVCFGLRDVSRHGFDF